MPLFAILRMLFPPNPNGVELKQRKEDEDKKVMPSKEVKLSP